MPRGRFVKSCSQSNKTEPFVSEKCQLQKADNPKSTLNVIVTEQNNSKLTKGVDDHTTTKVNSEYGAHFDFAPWLSLDCMKQNSTADPINSVSKFKKAMDDPQKRKEMLLKYEKIYRYNSFDSVIILDEEDSDVFKDSSEDSSEKISEEELNELRRRMLGHID